MIGVIADDLTGAAELGALGWRHGLRSAITGFKPCPSDADLICINTDSRSLASQEAATRAALAANALQGGGARWIYKKVDSVLRGHVVAETKAILTQLGRQSALIVAANPAKGRVILHGEYFIAGTPIEETEFGRDPGHPRRSSKVLDLVGSQEDGNVLVCGAGAPLPAQGIVLGEAESTDDLLAWAARCSPSMLTGGAAEFFEVLLNAETKGAQVPGTEQKPEAAERVELFVCGTRSDAAGRFLDAAKRLGVPVFSWPEAAFPGMDDARTMQLIRHVAETLRTHLRVVLTGYFCKVSGAADADKVARELSRLAFAVMQRAAVSHVHVEGGATASFLLGELGWDRLEVVGEMAPGVVTLQPAVAPRMRVTLKPGSYVWPDAILRRPVRCLAAAPGLDPMTDRVES